MTLMIKDLSVSKEFDDKAMSTVHGGLQTSFQGNYSEGGALAVGSGGVGNVTLALNLPTMINLAVPTLASVNVPVAIGVGGTAVA
jgi:hypothetical protein